MNLAFTKEEEAFRHEVRAFFKTALPTQLRDKLRLGQRHSRADMVEWQRILNAKGWGAPGWPVEWGGCGWTGVQLYIFREELQCAWGLDQLNQNINLVGPVIIAFGSQAQKTFFLPKIRNMDLWFCQGFSEPGAGSDLASLRTSAVRDGDHYVVNGTKMWTSQAHRADWMFALVRTDPNVKKQKGISYLLIDMKSPGVTVRPIITLDGEHFTNQIFFDDVRVPVENLIGQENKGWDYAKYLLGNERAGGARVGMFKVRIARAKELARGIHIDEGFLSDSRRFRERVAMLEVDVKALEITAMRVISGMRSRTDHRQDPKASVLKLSGSELFVSSFELLLDLAGPHAMAQQLDFMAAETDEVIGPDWGACTAPNFYMTRERTIAGGSNEIQRNVVAKAILGL